MIGDLLIRFYKEYKKDGKTCVHPKDFEGIVIIDELDLHLHPKWLRRLPAILSGLFPKIQFIAATHSEIPVLGAPKDTVLLKVTRTQKEGIRVERVHVDFKNLPPQPPMDGDCLDMAACRVDSEIHIAETPLLLHPEVDRPEEHLIFLPNGEIEGKSLKGETNVKICKLSRPGLVIAD